MWYTASQSTKPSPVRRSGKKKLVARQAPVSPVPVSYMQGQHIRGVVERTGSGLEYSRQIIATCEVPGQCDIAAMNEALNSYLRRHDTYRSWFEYTDDGDILRHTLTDPDDLEFEPVNHGELAVEDVRTDDDEYEVRWSLRATDGSTIERSGKGILYGTPVRAPNEQEPDLHGKEGVDK